ncbi:MAG: SUMF1/EgtB/PvdO family nonheme iron enzyme [Nitrospira sp.]
MATIYLSSTYEDLKDFRSAVVRALRQSQYYVINMEDYVANAQRPVDTCFQDTKNADIYVGVFAFRYGYIPPPGHDNPNGLSITELELRYAQHLKKPCLTFLADQTAPGFPQQFVDAFTGEGEAGKHIKRLRDELSRERTASFFSAPYQLASLVQAAVTSHLKTHNLSPLSGAQQSTASSAVIWDIRKNGSPYPGLMHFSREYAPVFFGREREVREILDRMREPDGRFLLISGASGSGKSSLVDAGILPRIEKDGIVRGKRYTCVRMVPSRGSDLFDALFRTLHPYLERVGMDACRLAEELRTKPFNLSKYMQEIVANGLHTKGLVLFLDQMEELFAVRDENQSQTFLSALYKGTHDANLHVIATIRSDFLQYCHEHENLLHVLNGRGHYGLGPIDAWSLSEMIANPAHCSGLTIAERLVRRLVEEVGHGQGSLPLLAFALWQLFDRRVGDELTEAAFDQLGGLTGAIHNHITTVEDSIVTLLGADEVPVFAKIFAALVVVTIDRMPIRRWVSKESFDVKVQSVIDVLVKERLLNADKGKEHESLIAVAHEALFGGWSRLAAWIEAHREELFILRQAEIEAGEWERHDYDLNFLWSEERLMNLRKIIEGLGHERVCEAVRRYAVPQDQLIKRLQDRRLSHNERCRIGEYLAALGDPRAGVGVKNGLPDIVWIEIPGGVGKLKSTGREFDVKPFRIGQYPVTNAQFQSFLTAEDGYRNDQWWKQMEYRRQVTRPSKQDVNCPRETVSWFEAVAFCRWLSSKTETTIRLPTQWEWQQAATGGNPRNEYPWEGGWDSARCNSGEGGLNGTIAVGMYPAGVTQQGVHDMAGNVWEWCLTSATDPDSALMEEHVLRGGFWFNEPESLHLSMEDRSFADVRQDKVGFRLVQEIEP